MVRRLFPSDKNYLITNTQVSQKELLLNYLVSYVKAFYQREYNPLGLIDDTITKIQQSSGFPVEAFDEFYHDLAAVFRFKNGEVQLEFLFDGTSHYDKYKKDWENFFKQNIRAYCLNRFFVRAVLDIAVFHNQDRVAFLAGDRLKYFLTNYYGLKVYKYRGIMSLAS